MSKPAAVLVEKRGEFMIITLNRPNQGNALLLNMYHTITAALEAATKDSTIKGIVLTGSGKFFSTGADVAEAATRSMNGQTNADLAVSIRNGPVLLTQTLIDFPKFAVALVNGPVVGYPAGLLGLFDVVLVSSSATYQTPFMWLGLVPEAGSSYTAPRNIGHAMAADLLLTNRKLSALEMVQCGIASRVLPEESFLVSALAIVEKGFKESSGASLVAAKSLMRAAMRTELFRVNLREADGLIARFDSGEPNERFAAVFMELQFKGKGKPSKL